MARGRGGSYDVGAATRRRYMSVDPEMELGAARRTQRLADQMNEDADMRSFQSRNKDRDLMNEITQRLHRVEFDGVKPSFDIAMKTGFRRKLYHKKLPPLGKEMKETIRKDHLRYPWDHTADNLYRPIKHKKEALEKSKKNQKQKTLKSYHDLFEEPPAEIFPVYDPMGVYKSRPKREHVPLPEKYNKYDNMNMREKLAQMRAKVESLPRARDVSKDVDTVLADLCRPLPRSQVAGQEMFTLNDDYDKDSAGLDEHLSKKIQASRNELEEFDRMLTAKFGTKKEMKMADVLGRKRTVPAPPPPQYYKYDYDDEQAGNAYVDPLYHPQSRPPPYHTNAATYIPRKLPESPLFIIAGSRRGGSVPPPRARVEVYEEEHRPYSRPLSPPPLPPRHIPTTVHHRKSRPSIRVRAASEPPPYRPLYSSIPHRSYAREVPYYTSREPYRYYSSSVPYYQNLTTSESPYFKRRVPYYVYENEEPIYRATYSRQYAPTQHAAVRNARRHLDTLERELGMQNGPVIDEPVIIHHVHAGPTARVVAGPRATRASYRVAAPLTGSVTHRSSSLPPSPRGVPRRSRVADIEAYYEDLYGYEGDLVNHQVRPYQPYQPSRVVTTTISDSPILTRRPPIVPRMPSLDRHRPHQGTIHSSHIPPYKPASTHKPPSGTGYGSAPRTNSRPAVSETRKRIREVMCATKKDPHYYD